MPKTKPQSLFFTAITAWMMVYGMTLYNLVLATGSFTNASFLLALKEMWLEFVVIFFCAFFISSLLASVLGVWHAYGFTANLLPDYLTCVCKNFVMALPLQLIVVGPIARKTFRTVFHVKAV